MAVAAAGARPHSAVRPLVGSAAWFVPFLAFSTAFLLLPAAGLIAGSLAGGHGPTLHYLGELLQPQYLAAYATSIELSVMTAALGGLGGLLLAWAVVAGGLPRSLRGMLLTFSGVASNFAGIPLAFAFTSTLGPVGMLTLLLQHFGFGIYASGFTLFGFGGLVLTYLYFQIPLMVLLITPALEHAARWSEAAANLGASPFQYWWRIGLPILRLPLLGAALLLFGSGFGAYATAYALTSGMINLVPILIGQEMSGNVVYSPALGDALAVGMIVVMAGVFLGLRLVQRGSRT
jgi:putative spermidine/putrescine transport system permease protein